MGELCRSPHLFPELASYNVGPDEYLNLISAAKGMVDIPIIGSLNGISTGGWIEYAQKIEQAGADALELNIYYIPTDPDLTAATMEQRYLDVVRAVKGGITIPVAVKLSPYFSATANMAKRLAETGADALVLFNRFYQPDFDPEALEVTPHLVLSTSHELRLPLRWVAILYGRIPVDFAITSGVHTHEDALKGLMAGAKITMMTSELLQNGIVLIGKILAEMTLWLETHGYESVRQMQGSMSQLNSGDPAGFERANYMRVLQSWRQDPLGQMMFLPRYLCPITFFVQRANTELLAQRDSFPGPGIPQTTRPFTWSLTFPFRSSWRSLFSPLPTHPSKL